MFPVMTQESTEMVPLQEMPPPLVPVLLLTVQFVIVRSPPVTEIPPPLPLELFPVMTQESTVTVPLQKMPPPLVPVLLLTVQFVIVRSPLLTETPPPPLVVLLLPDRAVVNRQTAAGN